MRKFKHFEGNVHPLGGLPVGPFEFEHERGDAVAKLGVLRGERRFVQVAGQVEVEQPLLLAACLGKLLLKFGTPRPRLLVLLGRDGRKRDAEPVLHALRLLDLVEQRQHLLIEHRFSDAVPRMAGGCVPGASVVGVGLAGLLLDDLAGDGSAAVVAFDQFTGVEQFMGLVDLVTQ